MLHGPTTQTSLFARLRSSESALAWRDFHDRYSDLILEVARRKGLQASDCEDVLQEVLTSLLRHMERFNYDRRRGRFRSFLKAVTLHTIYRKIRRSQASSRLLAGVRETISRPDDEALWESQWQAHHVRMALAKIEREFPWRSVQAFRLFALQNMDVKAVADCLGVTTHQVYKAKARIMERMRQIVESQIEAETA